MTAAPDLDELLGTVVVLRDPDGQRARYVVDHISSATVICSYVFRGRHRPPTQYRRGDEVQLGAAAERGWMVVTGKVHDLNREGAVVVAIEDVRLEQRRQHFREDVVLRLTLREDGVAEPRTGRTENISVGGFAARLSGSPVPEGTEAVVTFAMPDKVDLVIACRKIAGDLQQRFCFVDADRHAEDRIAKVIRESELEKRRARKVVE